MNTCYSYIQLHAYNLDFAILSMSANACYDIRPPPPKKKISEKNGSTQSSNEPGNPEVVVASSLQA